MLGRRILFSAKLFLGSFVDDEEVSVFPKSPNSRKEYNKTLDVNIKNALFAGFVI